MNEDQLKPKRSWPRKILLGCGGLLLVLLVFGGIIAGIAFWATGGVADAGNAFMTALNTGDYATAYDHLNPALKDQFGNPDAFADIVAQGSVVPKEWSFTSRNMENNLGELSGSVTYEDDHAGDVALKLEYVNEQWLICDLALNR